MIVPIVRGRHVAAPISRPLACFPNQRQAPTAPFHASHVNEYDTEPTDFSQHTEIGQQFMSSDNCCGFLQKLGFYEVYCA